jgi:hypothetical protein
MTGTTELRSIYSGPIRRALERTDRHGSDLESQIADLKVLVDKLPRGIVAEAALSPPNPVIAANVWGNVTNALPVLMEVGRRYRVVLSIRATGNTAYPSAFACRLSLNTGVPTVEQWRSPSTSYEGGRFEWNYNGDGQQHSLTCQMMSSYGNLTVFTDATGWFYCEDFGKAI